ncbi:hypothetical protein [Empedobacter stercoris]|uniref:hypothetical protein n=1 Tax=Empedobacter stercoris TaxID=1628248 RepID=UPI001CE0CE7F|nr:hypothetical protein [Empedobacter stercoris]
MKKNQQMKPQDIVLLLKIIAVNNENWEQKPIAEQLGLSQSEVSESVARSKYAGLLNPKGKSVMRFALLEFLEHGVAYVFPQKPGSIVRGVATAHSTAPLSTIIQSNEFYVWPYGKGNEKGHGIEPLYKTVPKAVLQDSKLHELLALVDAIRVGRAREKELAVQELKNRILNGE